MDWYQQLGVWAGSHPFEVAALFVAAVCIELVIVVVIRKSHPEDYQ